MSKRLQMVIDIQESDCDSCGYWSSTNGKAFLEGELIATASGDSHLSGGPSTQEECEAVLFAKVLEYLGVELLPSEVDYTSDYYNYEDS